MKKVFKVYCILNTLKNTIVNPIFIVFFVSKMEYLLLIGGYYE